jgi:hypothetical protein
MLCLFKYRQKTRNAKIIILICVTGIILLKGQKGKAIPVTGRRGP